jgi:predicted DsbA family dithiol-disulfide isomerase
VEGVPFFIFDRRLAVSGAQEPEVLVQAIERAAEHSTDPA